MELDVTVWVCPNCASYYASSNAGDLREKITGERGINFEDWPERAHPRSWCAYCTGVDRIPIVTKVAVEVPEQASSA